MSCDTNLYMIMMYIQNVHVYRCLKNHINFNSRPISYSNCYIFFLNLQMRRFERKRKPPTPRRKVVKISGRDVQSAAECLLDLGKEMSGSHTPSSCEEQDVEVMHMLNK